MNPMQVPRIEKVTVHICTGESGERLTNAENVLKAITKQMPVRAKAKKTLPAFNIKKREPIACKVTLRGTEAEAFLKTAFGIEENKLRASQFDRSGNFAFGISEHTDFPGMKYDPTIGIYGMDVTVTLERPGYRVSKRKIEQRDMSKKHRLTRDDAVSFVKQKFGVEVV